MPEALPSPSQPEKPEKEIIAKPLSQESTEPEKTSVKKKVPPTSPVSETPDSVHIDIKLNDKPKDTKPLFNFKKGTYTSEFVKQKTEGEILTPTSTSNGSSSSSSSPSSGSKDKVEEIRAQMLAEETQEANKMTYDDYADTADMIVDLVDFAVVFLIRTISLDTTDAPYQPQADKINKLKKHLTRYLIRQNKKFNMGFLMLLAILAAYGTPLRKSIEHRSLVLAERAKKRKDAKPEEIKESQGGNPLKKKPGRQSK